jgi:hypothetical protein
MKIVFYFMSRMSRFFVTIVTIRGKKIPLLYSANAIKPDEKNVKYCSTAVHISNIS